MNYIGFDLGDGESAIAILEKNSKSAKSITIDGKDSFPTAVGTLKETHAHIIGNNAIANESICDNFRVCFKQLFANADGDAYDCYQRFVSVVLSALRDKISDDISDPEKYRFVIGHPAGWNDNLIRKYENLISSCHIDRPLLVSESRAALICYASSFILGNSMSGNPDLSILVCDFGSSTIDFAYLPNGRTDEIRSLGHKRLGGGMIDRQIVVHSIRKFANRKDRDRILTLLETDKSLLSLLSIKARELKEKFFIADEKGIEFSKDITVQRHGIEFINITVNDEIIDLSLNTPIHECNDESLEYALESILNEVAANLDSCPIDKVVLTGGASRMQFFRNMCDEHFNTRHLLSSSPETDIAKGLALDGQYKFKMDCLKEDMDDFMEGTVLNSMISNNLKSFCEDLSSAIIDDMTGTRDEQSGVLRHALSKWVENGNTIRDLAGMFDAAAADYLNTGHFNELMENSLSRWIRDCLLPKVQSELNTLCRKNGIAPNKAAIKEMTLTEKISMKGIKLVYVQGEFGPITFILSLLGLTYDMPIPNIKPFLNMREIKSKSVLAEKNIRKMKNRLSEYLITERHFSNDAKKMLMRSLKDCIRDLETEIRI